MRNSISTTLTSRRKKDKRLHVWQEVQILTGVVAGAVHSSHPGALLAGGRLPQGQVDDVDQRELLVVP